MREYDYSINRLTDTWLLAICVAVSLASVGRLWVFFVLFLVFVCINAGLKYYMRRLVAKEENAIDELMRELYKKVN